MTASVLILVRNEARWIGPCLQAVYAQSVRPLEVIVVDSGSTDGTLEIMRQFPVRLTCIPTGEFHHGRTRNLAASLARGECLVYLGGDAVPASPQWLEALLAPLADSAVDAVYGRQIPRADATRERQNTFAYMYGEQPVRKNRDALAKLGYRLYNFSTVTCAIRQTVWQRFPFAEDLPVFEDIAFAKRLLDAGGTIWYTPDAAVVHSHNYPLSKQFRRFYDAGAIRQRLGIWQAAQGTRSPTADGWAGLRARIGKTNLAAFLGEFGRDAVKWSGLWLGRHERWLPLPLKRRLTCFGVYDSPSRGGDQG